MNRPVAIRMILLFAGLALGSPTFGQAVPSLMSYQGRLSDSGGRPYAAGMYAIQFRLWNSPTAAGDDALIWAQSQNVPVQSNGVFNVILGAPGGSSIPGVTPKVNELSYAFSEPSRYLSFALTSSNGVALPGHEVLSRSQLLAAPFAFMAATAITAINATNAINAVNAERASTALTATTALLASSVAPGSIIPTSLASGVVDSTHLKDGSVTPQKLAPREIGPNVGAGGVAISPTGDVSLLSVTITVAKRPLYVGLIPGEYRAAAVSAVSSRDGGSIRFKRDNVSTAEIAVPKGNNAPSMFGIIEVTSPGVHTYSIQLLGTGDLFNVRLVAFEL